MYCSSINGTMLLRFDRSDADPIYDQIAASVRRSIAEGDLEVGDRLPPARELARALGVNVHTVLRGYAQLRDEGIIEMRRGRGSVVLAGGRSQARLRSLARELCAEARRQGIGIEELAALIDEEMS